ncbi:MAG: lipopolysaccharide heptosyltransferase II [Vicinamibacterales bacterium]
MAGSTPPGDLMTAAAPTGDAVTAAAHPVARLVVRPPNWLGDAVLALPALAAVRQAFPDAHLTVAATAGVTGLFDEITDVRPDAVVELPRGTNAAVAELAPAHFDLGVLFPNSFRSAWQFRRAGIRERWGYARAWRGSLLTKAARPPRARHLHQADYYRALVRGLGLACGDAPPRVAASARALQLASTALVRAGLGGDVRLVGVAPGAAYGQAKQWPPDRMAELCARLVRAHGVKCVLLGAAHDRDAARAVESWLRTHAPDARGGVVSLVGHTNLAAFTGIAARTEVFVSNDSGAMHLAAALGRPVVALFGPTDERATRPIGDHDVMFEPVFCRPCMLRDCPIDHRCMKRLTVDRVLAAVARRLERRA